MAQTTRTRTRMVASWALKDGDQIAVGRNVVTVTMVLTENARSRRVIGRTGIDDDVQIICNAGLKFRLV